ncbi:MAG: xylose isomerase [Planctomycetaceae bacterium]|nr:xylose isomerase [Planctomycetaceae bacterium]|tara:strand:+ start:677 stop:1495 length:819 start_codon:yes stop_codon:yes gene_type:complete
MPRLSISEVTTYSWSFQSDVRTFARYGVPAMGIWRQKLADYGEEKGAELLAETGMDVSTVYFAGGFTGHDGRSFQEAVDDAEQAIETASLLQAECLTIYTGARAGHTKSHAQRLMQMAFEQLLPVAEVNDVVLALEPMHPRAGTDWTFMTDLEATLRYVESMGSHYFKMAIDTYHWGRSRKFYSLIRQLVPQLAVVFLGDASGSPDEEQNRCLLGDGSISLERMVTALLENGYDGCFDVRLTGEELESLTYSQIIEHSCRFYEDLIAAVKVD